MDVLLYVVRHGATDMNAAQIRGYAPVSLNAEGAAEAVRVGKKLLDKGVRAVRYSPLPRARETATRIASMLQVPAEPASGLITWDVGQFTGQPIATAAPLLNSYVLACTTPVPGGEPYATFYERFRAEMSRQLAQAATDGPRVLVTHESNILALPFMLSGGQAPLLATSDKFLGRPLKPGIVLRVAQRKDGQFRLDLL